MKTKHTATYLLISALLLPIAAYATDTDQDRSSVKSYANDSVITTKIKAQLAEEKLLSTVHIKVDTENKGVVVLSGTAKTQADVNKAGSIASGVEGVTSVENNIHVAKTQHHVHAVNLSSEERCEARIKDLHARLEITQPQEEQWSKVAQTMRDNEKQMDALTKTRAERSDMNAIDNLKSYGEITDEHADGIKRFTPVFATLYDDMSDAQKKNADTVFQHRGASHVEHKAS